MTKTQKLLKRLFDLSLSLVAFFLSFPIIISAWILASIDTRSNGIFLQKRIGLGGEKFTLIKIKTMKDRNFPDSSVTIKNDSRVSRFGYFLRASKIDELPQLINIILGDMSFVGPRPDVPGFADKLTGKERKILSVRPGITGPASIKYKNEETLLMNHKSPEKYNREVLWPDKVKINLDYVNNWTLKKDLIYIFKTLI